MAEQKISEEAREVAKQLKEAGYEPMLTRIAGKEYVYRGVTRKEWREILDARNKKLVAAGEDLVKQAEIEENGIEELAKLCVAYPSMDISKQPAGVYQALSDAILLESGFTGPQIEPIRL